MSLLNFFADVTRAHADLRGYDRKQAVWPEEFQCQNCGYTGPLNIHALCEACGSNSTQPLSLVGAK